MYKTDLEKIKKLFNIIRYLSFCYISCAKITKNMKEIN